MLSVGIGLDQAAEHFSAAGGDLQNAHAVANPGVLQHAIVCFGMKKVSAGWINRGDHVVHAARPLGDRARHPIFAGKKEGIVKIAQIWLPFVGYPLPTKDSTPTTVPLTCSGISIPVLVPSPGRLSIHMR